MSSSYFQQHVIFMPSNLQNLGVYFFFRLVGSWLLAASTTAKSPTNCGAAALCFHKSEPTMIFSILKSCRKPQAASRKNKIKEKVKLFGRGRIFQAKASIIKKSHLIKTNNSANTVIGCHR